MNLDGSNPVRLTYEPGIDAFPDWSPDGTNLTRVGSSQYSMWPNW